MAAWLGGRYLFLNVPGGAYLCLKARLFIHFFYVNVWWQSSEAVMIYLWIFLGGLFCLYLNVRAFRYYWVSQLVTFGKKTFGKKVTFGKFTKPIQMRINRKPTLSQVTGGRASSAMCDWCIVTPCRSKHSAALAWTSCCRLPLTWEG